MRRNNLITVILLTTLVVFSSLDVFSIPAFARKYQISCQVCHSPVFPQLKQFGDEFAGNGFRMTEYEAPRYFVPAGDEKLSLLRELPLAIRLDGFATFNFGKNEAVDFASPFVLKVLSGGELSEKLSYYFYFLFNERGEVAGIEDAFLMYHDLLGSGINLFLGQFQASDPLFKGELRFTLEPYRIYEATPGGAFANLKYDKGIIIDKGFSSGTDVVLEVLNGNGIGSSNDEWVFDRDKYKNVMLRIRQGAGPVSLGVFGYLGKENIPGGDVNSIWMAGPDLVINLNEKLVLNMQYVVRRDSDPGLGRDIMTQGGFGEVIFSPKGDMSNWYLTGLLNYVNSDDDIIDYNSATLHAGYILRRNVRLVSEYTYQFSGDKSGRFNVGVVSAF